MRQRHSLRLVTLIACGLVVGEASAQAGISVDPGVLTGTIGTNKGSVGPVQCPAGTVLSGVRHVDKATNTFVTTFGMTSQLGLYCSRVATDGTTVTLTQTTPSGTPEVPGFAYSSPGTVQEATCPAGQVVQRMGGNDRVTSGTFEWVSQVQPACRPVQLSVADWVQINTAAPQTVLSAGVIENNATHTFRGYFCDNLADTAVSGYHRQEGGQGYDGINIYCGGFLQARFSTVMTFSDFAWSTTLGGAGWLVDLRRGGVTLNDGGANNGAGRTPHATPVANINQFQSGREIYVVPGTGYTAQVAQRPAGIAANTFVTSGTCAAGITLANRQDGSCTLAVQGLPDLAVAITTSPTAYTHHGQLQDVTITATNLGPGAVAATDGFTLRTTLPAGWTATAVPGCTVVGQVVTCALNSVMAGAPAPGASGGSRSFTFPVTVNAPTASGTYTVSLALGRTVPDGDADPTNNDFNTGNDTATGPLVLELSTDVSIVKTATPDPALSLGQVAFTLAVRNLGPATANNARLLDPASAGLDCTAAGLPAPTCTATGGASCPSPLTAALIQTAPGVAIPALPDGGVVSVTLTCNVTATGLP
ncbi:DUF11 domain-containing protein [Pseudoxanthomonas sp. LH2527]|nr:DUF11 domain-containing protein [Pseudoxanthomonas sp. LH2527]